jgi:hypothetical protein
MKKTHQIGLMTALFAGVALTTFAQDPVQSSSTPASSDAAFRLSVGLGFGLPIDFSNAYNWIFSGSVQADIPILPGFDAGFYWQQAQIFWTGGSDLNTLGVEVAYSFGL